MSTAILGSPRRWSWVVAAGATLVSLVAPAAFARTSVTIWYEWEKPFIREMAKRFNASQKEIEVKVQIVGELSNDPAKLMASIAAGSPPNAVLGWSDQTYNWASRGVVLAMDQFIKTRKIDLTEYAEAAVKCCKYKGKIYGMPLDWDPDHALYVNKRIFSEAGLDWTRPPTLTADLEAIAAKLTTRDASGKYTRLGWVPWFGWQFWQIYWTGAFGGSSFDDAKDAVTLNGPRNVAAYNWLGDYTAKYTYSGLNSLAGDGWYKEKLAMATSGDWLSAITVNANKKLDFAVSRAPYPSSGKPFLASSGWAYMIPKGAKNLEATYKVIEWFSAKEQAAEFCKNITWLPANLEARKLPAIAEDPHLKWFVKLTAGRDDAIWLDPSPVGKTIWSELEKAAWLVVQGKKSAKDALDAAQRVAEVDLKRALARRIMR